MTLAPLESDRLSKSQVSGFGLPGAIHLRSPAPERSTFLLYAGGQDYVGIQSYDGASQTDE